MRARVVIGDVAVGAFGEQRAVGVDEDGADGDFVVCLFGLVGQGEGVA
jgi:hypothetical protein